MTARAPPRYGRRTRLLIRPEVLDVDTTPTPISRRALLAAGATGLAAAALPSRGPAQTPEGDLSQ